MLANPDPFPSDRCRFGRKRGETFPRSAQKMRPGTFHTVLAAFQRRRHDHEALDVWEGARPRQRFTRLRRAGIEAGITLVCGALAGADIFGHLGISGVDLGTSLSMLVMQHEIIGYVERIMRGIAFDDDTLGFDTIRKVGPGGNYLAEEHTALHFQSELWFPQLLDRNFWEPWRELVHKDMLSRCRAMKDDLLASHACPPLPDDVQRDVDQLLADARRLLVDSH